MDFSSSVHEIYETVQERFVCKELNKLILVYLREYTQQFLPTSGFSVVLAGEGISVSFLTQALGFLLCSTLLISLHEGHLNGETIVDSICRSWCVT